MGPMFVLVREKGRITIPASVRSALGLRVGDKLILSIERGAIVLRPEKVVRIDELRGVIGPLKVNIEDVEKALGRDIS